MLQDAPRWAQTFPGAAGLIFIGAIIGIIYGFASGEGEEIDRAWQFGGLGAGAGLLIWFIFFGA